MQIAQVLPSQEAKKTPSLASYAWLENHRKTENCFCLQNKILFSGLLLQK